MARPDDRRSPNYLKITLDNLISNLDVEEKKGVVILVSLTDRNHTSALARSQDLFASFHKEISQGFLKIVAPPSNIYPVSLFHRKDPAQRLPYGNTLKRSQWQSKLALDFAYLFSIASNLKADYFINFEDDVRPTEQHLANAIMKFVEQQNRDNPEWSSLMFSKWLSIGRLFRAKDLTKLVDLILIAYNKQPVDYIMSHYDMIRMADRYQEFRRKPPLLEHFGNISTMVKDDRSNGQMSISDIQKMEANRKRLAVRFNKLKSINPPARLSTNISQWLSNSLDHCYLPSNQSEDLKAFWGKNFLPGDVVDVKLHLPSDIKSVHVATGFGKFEDRYGDDIATQANILLSHDCIEYQVVSGVKVNDGTFQFNLKAINQKEITKQVRCVRFQIFRGQSDWLRIRLFYIRL